MAPRLTRRNAAALHASQPPPPISPFGKLARAVGRALHYTYQWRRNVVYTEEPSFEISCQTSNDIRTRFKTLTPESRSSLGMASLLDPISIKLIATTTAETSPSLSMESYFTAPSSPIASLFPPTPVLANARFQTEAAKPRRARPKLHDARNAMMEFGLQRQKTAGVASSPRRSTTRRGRAVRSVQTLFTLAPSSPPVLADKPSKQSQPATHTLSWTKRHISTPTPLRVRRFSPVHQETGSVGRVGSSRRARRHRTARMTLSPEAARYIERRVGPLFSPVSPQNEAPRWI